MNEFSFFSNFNLFKLEILIFSSNDSVKYFNISKRHKQKVNNIINAYKRYKELNNINEYIEIIIKFFAFLIDK